MSEDVIVWTWIKNFLTSIQAIDETKILLAYPVSTALPAKTDFVIITKLEQNQLGKPIETFSIPDQKLNIQNFQETRWQLDFYGKNAYNYSQSMYAYMLSNIASDTLNSFGYGVTTVDPCQQLTAPLDRDTYVSRYVIRFKLHYINAVQVPLSGITQADIQFNYVQVQ